MRPRSALRRASSPTSCPKNAGYTLLLSLFYYISPDPLTGRLVNAIASTLTTGLLILIGYRIGLPAVALSRLSSLRSSAARSTW